jgi:hypothetical protein
MSIDNKRSVWTENSWEGSRVRVGSLGDAVKVGISEPSPVPGNADASVKWAALSVAPAVRLAASLLLSASEAAESYGVPLTTGDVRKYFREVGLEVDDLI